MHLRFALSCVLLLTLGSLAHAQGIGVHGKFVDPTTGAAVPAVRVVLTSFADTSEVHRATAKDDGTFALSGLGVHRYRLEATRLGYSPLRIVVSVQKQGQDLGLVQLVPQAVRVGGITVRESPPPAEVHGDTTEFRAAAVKANPDATAEDLVQKLPGVTMENGTVKANGEAVQQVLVNGKPFFGSDPTAAMRNLPADVIDRIQVYDKLSDQAAFSGFDDGQSQKTMNFILRNRRATFGKAYAGYGDDDRYQTGGSVSAIKGTSRITAIGMSNNVNQQNFSPQDLIGAVTGNGGGGPRVMMFGGGGRGGGGPGGGGPGGGRMGGGGGPGGLDPSSFLVSQQGGVSTTHSGGLNYNGQLGPKLELNGSAFVNQTSNDDVQSLLREYTPPQDSTASYGQAATSHSRNGNQRIDGRAQWTPDSTNSVIYAPRVYFQDNHLGNVGDASYLSLAGNPLARSLGSSSSHTDADNVTNQLTLRHRFARRGRTISADFTFGHNRRNGDKAQGSVTDYFLGSAATHDTLDQRTGSNSLTNSIASRLSYTEPLTAHLQGQLVFNPSVSRSSSDARADRLDPLTGLYTVIDSTQSNTFRTRNTVENGGGSLLYSVGTWRFLGNVMWQDLNLKSDQLYPVGRTVDQTFHDVLPSAQVTGNFSNRRNLRVSYNTSTSTPSISQLQNVVDRSNPLAITAGNPGLHESSTRSLMLRWSEADPQHSKSRFVFLNLSRTANPISNATYTALGDTVIAGIPLTRGAQLTLPVNLDEPSWNANLFGVYSRPISWLKSIVSFNGGGTFSQTPTRLSSGVNVAKNWVPRAGAVFASNISENLDFTLSYMGTYNIARNSLTTTTTGDYYAHTLGLRFNGIAPHGIVVREEVNHSLQAGVAENYGRNVLLWNTTLGKKFLKGNRGELRVTLTDALNQDRSVNRSITESYVQDTRDQVLGRIWQAVFTYTFSSGQMPDPQRGRWRERFPMGPPPGGPPGGGPGGGPEGPGASAD